ncbi:hypothetical protein IAE37_000132 [Pseudomonas sp. S31]|uniref:hypothetical protein n=1 Tax=Pseudomonas sp. S31 TaxID=1564473 RepID=UPI0019117A83|nr:hypothetical protein [Pseudomonas sp. S31]MBK4997856.1 hypothetical protein [Pseudomonas sp. S31]
MPPFAPNVLATAVHDEVPFSLLDLVQQRLANLLGSGYTVVLAGSGDGLTANQYHLAIQHGRSGLSLEDNGPIGPGTVEYLLALGWRTKAMLESETFKRMGGDDPTRLVAWISDLDCPETLKASARQLQAQKS